MNRAQHRAKAPVLTQPHPAPREHTGAVVLKQDALFLVTAESGDGPFERPHALGFYLHDCRFLDGYTLRLNGPADGAVSSRGAELRDAPSPPEPRAARRRRNGGNCAGTRSPVRRQRLIRSGAVPELITAHNYAGHDAALLFEVRFGAEFEDVFIVKRFLSGPRGRVSAPRVVDAHHIELAYRGEDEVPWGSVPACPGTSQSPFGRGSTARHPSRGPRSGQ